MFFEDSHLKIRGERAGICAVDEIKLNRVLADYFVNSFHWIKGKLRLVDLQHFDNVMTKFIINKRTDA